MTRDKIEITLSNVDAQEVCLDHMSAKALESFLVVSEALKDIASQVSPDVAFSIEKGSARFGMMSSTSVMDAIYRNMELAIEGESEDEVVTSSMRKIQQELQQEAYMYQFSYGKRNIGQRLSEAKRISKKKVKKYYQNELEIIEGYFNSIGGNDPNYHFDYGIGKKVTVVCTIEDAGILKKYLYSTITCLVNKKVAVEDDEHKMYKHCSKLERGQVAHLDQFMKCLNNTEDLMDRLDLIYDFIDESENKKKDLTILLKHYNLFFNDINEFKTLLIISDGFRDVTIQGYRTQLELALDGLLTKA